MILQRTWYFRESFPGFYGERAEEVLMNTHNIKNYVLMENWRKLSLIIIKYPPYLFHGKLNL